MIDPVEILFQQPMPEDLAAGQADGELVPVAPLTVWSPSQVLAWQEPPGMNLLGPWLRKGELTVVFGPPGIGKSRLFGLWLPICQIVGQPFCGLATGGDPQTWLVIGNENNIARQKSDLEKMLAVLSEAQRAAVERHLRIHVLRTFEDGDLALGSVESAARLRETLTAEKPGGISFDPVSALVDGDEVKPGDVRLMLKTLHNILRPVCPDAALLLIAHAKVGREAVAQSGLYDAGNYGRGPKTYLMAARCVMNLKPGDNENETRLVLENSKCNNGPLFQTRGLIFDPGTGLYSVDSDFDREAWQADVAGRKTASVVTVAEVVRLVKGGTCSTEQIVAALSKDYGISSKTVQRRIGEAKTQGWIEPTIPRGNWIPTKKAGRLK
jgi:energy-coupling factor transporter ATP-binding protein EcfA2